MSVQYETKIAAMKQEIGVPTVTIDMNDAAFLAVLVTQYIAKGNDTDHLQSLVVRLTPNVGE